MKDEGRIAKDEVNSQAKGTLRQAQWAKGNKFVAAQDKLNYREISIAPGFSRGRKKYK